MTTLLTHHEPDLPRGLAAGTLVTTPDGDKPIEDVKAGDLVLSGVGHSETRFYPVGKVISKPYVGSMLHFATYNHHHLYATPKHVCFGYSSKYLKMPEDSIFVYNFSDCNHETGQLSHHIRRGKDNSLNESEVFTNIDNAAEAARQMAQSDGGVEIQNFACLTHHPTHKFVRAGDLQPGMEMPIIERIGKTNDFDLDSAAIKNIYWEQYDGLVYDLDIPEARNFAANGVLVHDSTRF